MKLPTWCEEHEEYYDEYCEKCKIKELEAENFKLRSYNKEQTKAVNSGHDCNKACRKHIEELKAELESVKKTCRAMSACHDQEAEHNVELAEEIEKLQEDLAAANKRWSDQKLANLKLEEKLADLKLQKERARACEIFILNKGNDYKAQLELKNEMVEVLADGISRGVIFLSPRRSKEMIITWAVKQATAKANGMLAAPGAGAATEPDDACGGCAGECCGGAG